MIQNFYRLYSYKRHFNIKTQISESQGMERDATSKHMKAGLAQVMQISRTKSPPEIKEDSFFSF